MNAETQRLEIGAGVSIPLDEIDLQAMRAQGASSAIHLRFDIPASSLPEIYRERLLALRDSRISGDGVLVIKAQRFRSQEKNRQDALERLRELVQGVTRTRKARVATRPTRAARKRRMDDKTRRGQVKALRGRIQKQGSE